MLASRQLVLTFHGLGEPSERIAAAERKVWVPLEWFEAILDELPRDGVGVAFDDGNSSDVERALPALCERGLTARFFVLAGRVDAAGYVSREEIARLHAAGMAIGSHGVRHCDWRELADRELEHELRASRELLAEIVGAEVDTAACPFGSYDRRVLRALRAAGYRTVYNSDGGTVRASSWLVPRTTVNRDRPLRHWLDLARDGLGARASPTLAGKRLVKRLR